MKKSPLVSVLAAFTAAFLLSGCATAFSTNEYTVNIRTPDNPGVDYEVQDSRGEFIYAGTTPDIVRLKSQGHDFHRETYTISAGDESFELKAGISPIYWANVVGLIGFAVDYATGAMWSLPSHIDIENFEQSNILLNTDF